MNKVIIRQHETLIELMQKEQIAVRSRCDNLYHACMKYPVRLEGFPAQKALRKLNIDTLNEIAYTLLREHSPEAFDWMQNVKTVARMTEREALELALAAPPALPYVFDSYPDMNFLKRLRHCRDRLGLSVQIRKLERVVFTVTKYGLARQLGRIAGTNPPTWEYREIEDQWFLLKYFESYRARAVFGLIIWMGPRWKIIVMDDDLPTWRTAGDIVVRRPGEVVRYGFFHWLMPTPRS